MKLVLPAVCFTMQDRAVMVWGRQLTIPNHTLDRPSLHSYRMTAVWAWATNVPS